MSSLTMSMSKDKPVVKESKIYKELDVFKRQIRMALIEEGIGDAPIRILLLTESLSDMPSYEALSYTWGDPSVTSLIYVSGEPFQVTTNLYSALSRLRYPQGYRTIWIDAICINQDDVGERTSQVQLMRQIYESCERVMIWLGEKEQDLRQCLELLERLGGNVHVQEMAYFREPTGSETFRSQARALTRIMNASWWSRVWTLQEVILAPKAVIQCGGMSVPWSSFIRASLSYTTHSTTCCKVLYFTVFGNQQLFDFEPFKDQLMDVAEIVAARNQGMETDLLHLLQKFRNRKATDPRDKIYGFLGLLADEQAAAVAPNYLQPVESVYTGTATYHILDTRSLQILGYTFGEKNLTRLPSWVPDWTADIPHPQYQALRSECYDLYNACLGYAASAAPIGGVVIATLGLATSGATVEVEDPPQSPILITRGLNFDVVAKVGELLDVADQPRSCRVLRQWQQLIGLPDESNDKLHLNTGCTLQEAFWRTVFCDVIWDALSAVTILQTGFRRARPMEHLAYYAWWEWYQTSPDETADYPPDLVPGVSINDVRATIPMAILQRFFVTEKGFLGLGPAATRAGDQVHILPGGKRPLVLRPAGGHAILPSRGPESCHALVGETYVNGIMDGEAMGSFESEKENIRLV